MPVSMVTGPTEPNRELTLHVNLVDQSEELHVTHCLKLKSGMVTQPRGSVLRRCLLFSSAPPGGGRGLAYSVTVSWDSRGSWVISTGKHTLRGEGVRERSEVKLKD